MTPTLLILRPQPGAAATAARAAARGMEAIVAPLFTVRPLPWHAPSPDEFDAVLLTSANAARCGGQAIQRYRQLPVYAVGAATTAAARAIGFSDVRSGDSNAVALFAMAASEGKRRLLHLTGREHHAPTEPGISVTTCVVYAADSMEALPDLARASLATGAVALLHSPRAARLFRMLAEAAGIKAEATRVAAISPAAVEAAGKGWLASTVAHVPTDAALLDAALRLCDQGVRKDG